MNLKAILNKINSIDSFKKVFDRAIGVYFNDDKIFCVNVEFVDNSTWKIIDTAEISIFENEELTENLNDIEELIAKKVFDLRIDRNWTSKAVALCLNDDRVITEIEDLSNVPKDRLSDAVKNLIAAIGNFEPNNFYSSYIENFSNVWLEGISKIDADKWINAFEKNNLSLLALTAIPVDNEFVDVKKIDLTNADKDFLERGGMKAIFAVKSLIYQTTPNFFINKTKDLNGWNFSKIAALIGIFTISILLCVTAFDCWTYYQAKSKYDIELEALKKYEKDIRLRKVIENDQAEFKNKQKILSTLTENKLAWRSLLIHLGTIKTQGVWLREIHTSDDRNIEIKGEAVNYEKMSAFVTSLENDTEILNSSVELKNSTTKNDSNLVQFEIMLSFTR